MLLQLTLVFVLVLVNGALTGTELALVSLREGQLQRLERGSGAGRLVARLARDPNRFLSTIQIGVTLAGFLASASAAVSLSEPLVEPLSFLGSAAPAAAVVIVTVILSYVTLVLGELAPKRLAMQRAEGWARLAARPLTALAAVTRPVVWLLSRSTDVVVRLAGGDPDREREDVTTDEIREMVASQADVTPAQRDIIDGAFEIADRSLRQVLQPRPEVFVLAAGKPCGEALTELAASGHSRAPVAPQRSLDEVAGIVHLRDLMLDAEGCVVDDVMSEPLLFPESVTVLDALRQLQARHSQMAIIVNEHGSAEGIVTVEDLVEELVGEIYDEADRDVMGARRLPDGSFLLVGRYPIHDLVDLGIHLPADDSYTTLAGLVLDRLGRIPEEPGDVIVIDGWELTVEKVGYHTVTSVRLRRTAGGGRRAGARGAHEDRAPGDGAAADEGEGQTGTGDGAENDTGDAGGSAVASGGGPAAGRGSADGP